MVIVILLAAGVSLFRLNTISFWEDESWLAQAMSGSVGDLLTFSAERGVHPPLYFLIAYLLKPFIGDGEFAMRWTSGFFGLLGIAFTYRLGATLLNRRSGVYAAWLASGSLFWLYFARLARQYTLFYLLAAALIWAYWRWRKNHNPRWLLAIALIQAAALYTHYFSAFLGMTLALHALFTLPWRRTFRLWGALVVAGVLFLPWIPAIFTQLSSDLGEGLFYGVRVVPQILENYTDRVTNATPILGYALGLVGVVALVIRNRWTLLLLFGLWIVATLAVVILVNQTLFLWYIGRNLLYTLPAMVILYGAGLAYLSRWKIGAVVAMAAALIWLILGVAGFSYFWPGTPDWRGAMERIAQSARSDDLYVIEGEPYSTQYYLRRYLDAEIGYTEMHSWWLEPSQSDRIWLITDEQNIPNRAINALQESMMQTRRVVQFPIVAELYQLPPEEITATFDEQIALGYRGEERISIQAGDTLFLDVWWQAIEMPAFNYSVSFQLWDDSGVLVQQDGNFGSGQIDAQVLPIGAWSPDTRIIEIPADAAPGEYTLRVTVYDWRDNSRLPVTPADEEALFSLLTVIVEDC